MLISSRPSAAKERSPLVDEDGQPLWSMPAMVVAAIFTSLPFALLHGEQTGYSLGPFVQIFAVSLILCAVRLKTRSLAASTLVHACYNFLIFSIMMLGTGGFRHLDKM
jgi:membrane protease YdiL (CAAX protease family)